MDRSYDHETGKHNLSLSSEELKLVYKGLSALAGAALLQSSAGGESTVNASLLSEMRDFVAKEGH